MNEKPLKENTENAVKAFRKFLETIQTLRAPGGCPWDREQTPLSMRPPLVEECFEAVDAITSQDSNHAKEELGDVLLNTLMISYMYEQNEDFSVADVLNEVSEKLVRRHPHVWPESQGASEEKEKAVTSGQVLNQWDRIKQNVEGRKASSILDEVPEGFPPMLKAFKFQKKAGKKGFEWTDSKAALEKVNEELKELLEAQKEAEGQKGNLHVEEEAGDLLFAVINYIRMLGIDPQVALSRTNNKFYKRFTYVEEKMEENKIPMDKNHLDQAISLWKEAKESDKIE